MMVVKIKAQRRCVIKRKLKSENYKSCLKATQLENEINYPEKNNINIDVIKEFIKTIINAKNTAKV